MIERRGQYGDFLGCTNYPKCNHSVKIKDENKISENNPF